MIRKIIKYIHNYLKQRVTFNRCASVDIYPKNFIQFLWELLILKRLTRHFGEEVWCCRLLTSEGDSSHGNQSVLAFSISLCLSVSYNLLMFFPSKWIFDDDFKLPWFLFIFFSFCEYFSPKNIVTNIFWTSSFLALI